MKKSLFLAGLLTFAMQGYSQTLIDESFDGTALPTDWTKSQNNAIGWVFGTTASLSSAYWAIPAHDGNCAASNDDAN